jgi:hypothetical protein
MTRSSVAAGAPGHSAGAESARRVWGRPYKQKAGGPRRRSLPRAEGDGPPHRQRAGGGVRGGGGGRRPRRAHAMTTGPSCLQAPWTGCGPWSWASDTTDTQRGPPWLRPPRKAPPRIAAPSRGQPPRGLRETCSDGLRSGRPARWAQILLYPQPGRLRHSGEHHVNPVIVLARCCRLSAPACTDPAGARL